MNENREEFEKKRDAAAKEENNTSKLNLNLKLINLSRERAREVKRLY